MIAFSHPIDIALFQTGREEGSYVTWTIPIASFLTSAGWWENYVDQRLGSFSTTLEVLASPHNALIIIFQVIRSVCFTTRENQREVEEDPALRLLHRLDLEDHPLLRHHASLPPPQWCRHLSLVQLIHK